MSPDRNALTELHERVAGLTTEEQLLLVQGILARIRQSHFSDPAAYRRELEDLVAHERAGRRSDQPSLPFPESAREAG
ncbi:MAG: hypothetical protein JWO38_603 [Gemmataceae bacterium]|nr:hypothetical protein [Gemmataceae bacterium]